MHQQSKKRQGPGEQAPRPARTLAIACTAVAALLGAAAHAQNFPITPGQRSTAQQVAQAGVPLEDLAPDAPDSYTVKTGDTLWRISGMFLKSPWRWPELWGMNMNEVRNPHLIFPGQELVLERANGRARLRVRGGEAVADAGIPTVRVSPRVRVQPLADTGAIPTLQANLIEPFLNEAQIVDESVLKGAPRIVAVPENRVMITRGDRAYARGVGTPWVLKAPGHSESWRVFRDARAIRDPDTHQVLGYEAAYLGKAELVRSEATSEGAVVPATIDVVFAKDVMTVGDRLLPEPPRSFTSYAPHAPHQPLTGKIVSVYGDAVSLAGQNQVVLIDKGVADGVDVGTVMAIQKAGARVTDGSTWGSRTAMKLPDERNGLLMVFRAFDKLSYALILEINDAVQVGDRVANPR